MPNKLTPINPSPCIPGVPDGGIGGGWAGVTGPGWGPLPGDLDRLNPNSGKGSQGDKDGGSLKGTGEVATSSSLLTQAIQGINGLAQAFRTLANGTSKNFRELQSFMAVFEESQAGGFGVLRGPLHAGGEQTAERLDWNGSQFVASSEFFIVRDIFLNTGESVDSGTVIHAVPYQGVIVVNAMYCSARDPAL